MKYQKGKTKTGGRQKGTPNKNRSIFESLEEIHTEDGKPVDIVKLFFDGLMIMPPFQRVDALLEFMKFVFPRQQNMQISQPEDGTGFKIIVEDYKKKDE